MAGWVGDLSVHPVAMHDEKLVLTVSVRHSQSVSASYLKPWVAAEKCGNIICAHSGAWRGMRTHCCLTFCS